MILADVGPLYALAMKRDALHARAHKELTLLKSQGLVFAVSTGILLETHKLILRRERPAFAASYAGSLLTGSALINLTGDDCAEAQRLLERYPDQKISLFDAGLYILSQRLNLPIWTFDVDFDILQADVWRA